MKEKMKDKIKGSREMFEDSQTRQMNLLKMFRKIPFGRIIPPFSSKVQNLTLFSIFLHDSNSIFRAGRINSEIFFGRTVTNRPTVNVIVSSPDEWASVQMLLPSFETCPPDTKCQ